MGATIQYSLTDDVRSGRLYNDNQMVSCHPQLPEFEAGTTCYRPY